MVRGKTTKPLHLCCLGSWQRAHGPTQHVRGRAAAVGRISPAEVDCPDDCSGEVLPPADDALAPTRANVTKMDWGLGELQLTKAACPLPPVTFKLQAHAGVDEQRREAT
jgi:hypothetical protein